jgi:magnesium transporter
MIADLPEDMVQQVIQSLDDKEHAQDIVDLLRYDKDSTAGLMAKELGKVNENWTVAKCVR